jgi:hypothetical protein
MYAQLSHISRISPCNGFGQNRRIDGVSERFLLITERDRDLVERREVLDKED